MADEMQAISRLVQDLRASLNRLYGELTAPFRVAGSSNLFPGLVLPALVAGQALVLWRARRWASRSGSRAPPATT